MPLTAAKACQNLLTADYTMYLDRDQECMLAKCCSSLFLFAGCIGGGMSLMDTESRCRQLDRCEGGVGRLLPVCPVKSKHQTSVHQLIWRPSFLPCRLHAFILQGIFQPRFNVALQTVSSTLILRRQQLFDPSSVHLFHFGSPTLIALLAV
jgi:hypothetical protein